MGLHRLCVRPVSYTHLDVYKRQFKENPDGQFELGAAAYEKRGTAVTVPTWNAEKCIQCNQCAFVCSHATIRPFMLSEDEVKAAPSNIKLADTKPKASEYKYTMSVSPLDCMGCGECITVCPVGAIEMVPQESQAEEQSVFDYLVENVGKDVYKRQVREGNRSYLKYDRENCISGD